MTVTNDKMYWRFNGAYEVLKWSLEHVFEGLDQLTTLHPKITKIWADIQQQYPGWDGSIPNDPTGRILDHEKELRGMRAAENAVKCGTRTAICMAAIHFETTLNAVCYYSLGGVATEGIERLDWLAKMELLSAYKHQKAFRGSEPYKATRALQDWRNAFMHGKNPDRPANKLKDNHLVKTAAPVSLNTRLVVEDAITILECFMQAMGHLKFLNTSPEMDLIVDETAVPEFATKMKKYIFTEDGRIDSVHP